MKRFFYLAIILIVAGCKESAPGITRNESHGAALGTTYNLIYLTTNGSLELQEEIDSTFGAINRSLSTYMPESDISRINKGEEGIKVDSMFKEVFNLSKSIYDKTGGYFDPTVGLLVNAWGFGAGEQMEMDSSTVSLLLNRVGFDKVSLLDDGTIKKSVPDMYLEFNAIAKGYSIDRLAKLMDRHGVNDYLLEVGGELVAKGINQLKQKEWVVGIDDPQVEEGRELKATIRLEDRALASSGNYRHFRIDEETGKKYVHTIDPITGFTKNANTLAVTILADNCATADAYATAFMVMDLDEALKLLTSQKDLEAYIIYLDENGETQEFMSPGFEKLIVKN